MIYHVNYGYKVPSRVMDMLYDILLNMFVHHRFVIIEDHVMMCPVPKLIRSSGTHLEVQMVPRVQDSSVNSNH